MCDKPEENKDEHNYILYRGINNYVMMNSYPYNPGHLLIAPYRHTPGLEELTEEARNGEKNFFYFYTVRELRNIGIELIKWPHDKSLEKKVSSAFAGDVMRISFIKGIALGFNFPE